MFQIVHVFVGVKLTRIFSSSPRVDVCCFSSRSLSWEQIYRNQGDVWRSEFSYVLSYCYYNFINTSTNSHNNMEDFSAGK